MRPALVRRSTSVMSDGSGDVDMERLGDGKTRRAGVSASIYIYVYIYSIFTCGTLCDHKKKLYR